MIDVLEEFAKEDPVAHHARLSLLRYPDREEEILRETMRSLFEAKRRLTTVLTDFDRKYFPNAFPLQETPEEAATRITKDFLRNVEEELRNSFLEA